ncbi:hypothetical protein BD94_2800 [Elizabethkingia anophelis NUHP1]|uniref:Uncharacterized protein n=1 Tax=Elizabethkingia anophelis NUHP1 TaxID=1338011 RepID=A0A077EM49_9FLAO|nr:hypothetical protein BD94_2800 [Elizabethkingia anophelis NUHP1]KMU61867.1 hypothetical protein EZBTHKR_2451 [Elizabethkingia anophelis]
MNNKYDELMKPPKKKRKNVTLETEFQQKCCNHGKFKKNYSL